MPNFRKLTPEEIRDIEAKSKGIRKATAEQYDQFLSDFDAGEMGVVTLDGDDVRMTVMSRIKAAARRRDLVATFIRGQADTLRFRLITEADYTRRRPEPQPEPTPQKRRGRKPEAVASSVSPEPPVKKRGRPKKQSA